MPLRPCPLIPLTGVTTSPPAWIVRRAQELRKRRREHGSDFARIQPRNERLLRVSSLARHRVDGMQQRNAGAHDELRARQAGGDLAYVLDAEGPREKSVVVGEADLLVGFAAGCLEGCLCEAVGAAAGEGCLAGVWILLVSYTFRWDVLTDG